MRKKNNKFIDVEYKDLGEFVTNRIYNDAMKQLTKIIPILERIEKFIKRRN